MVDTLTLFTYLSFGIVHNVRVGRTRLRGTTRVLFGGLLSSDTLRRRV